ncbi:MAG TPA: hypothetical protein VD999_04190 [Vitreimonas sp.]|nr:hypothetical protein [Vitreimonas sp.]
MPPYLPVIFAIVLIVLTSVLTVVGVQIILVLAEMKKTLEKVNTTLDTAEAKLHAVTQPLQSLGGMASGLSTGFKVFEAFTGWLHRSKERDE